MPYTANKLINDLEAKTTPIDADSTVIGDSADTNRAKKTTWANIKATLKAYFDTLYLDGSGTADEIAYFSDSDTVSSLTTATYPSKTELSYVKGLTSSAQTQITAKAAKGANTDITSLGGLTTALSVAQGGTGATTLDDHYVLIGSGTSAITPITPDTAGKVLMSNGTSADPSFQTITALTGFGSWATATKDSATQVTANSLLIVYGSADTNSTFTVKTDSSNPPTTIRAGWNYASAGCKGSATVPVKKNDYYLIEAISGTTANVVAYIIPLA